MPQTSTGTPGTNIVAQCTVPADGDFVTGAGLKTAIDPINDDLATVKSGNCTIGGDKTLSGDTTITAGKSIVAAGSGCTQAGTWTFSGACNFTNKVAFRGRVFLSDADHTIGPSDGQYFTINVAGLTARTITLRKTTAPVPTEGQWLRVFAPIGATASLYFTREGDGGAHIVEMAGGTTDPAIVEFQFTGSEWYIVAMSKGFFVGAATNPY